MEIKFSPETKYEYIGDRGPRGNVHLSTGNFENEKGKKIFDENFNPNAVNHFISIVYGKEAELFEIMKVKLSGGKAKKYLLETADKAWGFGPDIYLFKNAIIVSGGSSLDYSTGIVQGSLNKENSEDIFHYEISLEGIVLDKENEKVLPITNGSTSIVKSFINKGY